MAIEVEQKGVGDPEKHDLARYLRRWLATLRTSGDYSPPTLLNCGHHIRRIIGEIRSIPLASDCCRRRSQLCWDPTGRPVA